MSDSKKPSPEGLWGVKDLNANVIDPATGQFIKRVHEILLANGAVKRIPLTADTVFALPEVEARKFLKDPAFEVTNADGIVVPAITEEQQDRVQPSRLAPQYVIARWTELTTDALMTRAGVRAGFEHLPPNPEREVLIDFLEGQFQAMEPVGNDDRGTDGDQDPDLAQKMLGGE